MLVDQHCRFEPVHSRHAYIKQNGRELVRHQQLQRLPTEPAITRVLAQVAENRLVGQRRRLVIDQQDIDAVVALVQRCSHVRSNETSCPVSTGLAT